MQASNYTKDRYFSQELSTFTAAAVVDVSAEFLGRDSWVREFFISSVFHVQIGEHGAPVFFAILRRAEAAFVEYDLFRIALSEYLTDRKRSSHYLRAVQHLELALLLANKAFTFLNMVGAYVEPDVSSLEHRLAIVSEIGQSFHPQHLPPGHLHAVWLRNEGVFAAKLSDGTLREGNLTFDELGELFRKLGKISDELATIRAEPSAP